MATEIDDLASRLARHLTVLQLEAQHDVPAPVLAQQAEIIARVATELSERLRADPTVKVRIDTRLVPGMETAFLDALGISTDVPDYPPEGS